MAIQIDPGRSLMVFNLTPMIDCVFLLLIFFLVAAQLADEERELDIKLPTASAAMPLAATPKELFVNIDREGRYLVAGRQLDPPQLEDVVRQAAATNPLRQAIQIRADKRSPLEASVFVFNLCKKHGIRDYAITTDNQ
jgi:biopolymer transport protein ExbD